MPVKLLLAISIVLLLFSCESYSPQPVAKKADIPAYTKTDVEDVELSYLTMKENKQLIRDNAQKGIDRAKRFEPLFLSLIAQYDFDHTISKSQIEPFRSELNDITSMFNSEEASKFSKFNAYNSSALETLHKEAKKGIVNNEAVEAKDAKIAELQAELDSKVSERTTAIAEKFFYLGGLLFVGSLFSIGFIAPIAGKLKSGGLGVLAVGGIIMAFGTFIDFIRDFLHEFGNWLLLLLLIPLILLFLGKEGDKAIDEIKDDDKLKNG